MAVRAPLVIVAGQIKEVPSGDVVPVASMPVMTASTGGAVPTPPNNTTTFLRGDGTFAAPAAGGLEQTFLLMGA